MAAISMLPAVIALPFGLPAEFPAQSRSAALTDPTSWKVVGRRLAIALNRIEDESDSCEDIVEEFDTQAHLGSKWDCSVSPSASTALPSSIVPGSVQPSEVVCQDYDSDDEGEESVGNSAAFRSVLGARIAGVREQGVVTLAPAAPQLSLLQDLQCPSRKELDEKNKEKQDKDVELGEESMDVQADHFRQIGRKLAIVFRAVAVDPDFDIDF